MKTRMPTTLRKTFIPTTMKIHTTTLTCLLMLTASASLEASPAKPVTELIEQLAKRAGRVPAKGAAEALEAAFKTHGARALEISRHSGIGLVEAAATHGDEVFAMAVRVPEAAPALAAGAERLLPLARGHGDDFLRLEARAPGLAEDAFRVFTDRKDVARLLDMPADDARKVLSYSAHATDPAAARALLDAVEKKGVGILQKLDTKQILAYGLSAAMVSAATGVSFTSGERLAQAFEKLSTIPVMLLSVVLCAFLIVLMFKSLRWLRSRRSASARIVRTCGGEPDHPSRTSF